MAFSRVVFRMNNDIFKISVIIPSFNAERYLRFAIESVLNQTVSPAEIIIVDDGSTDNSVSVSSSYASHLVRVIQRSHHGIAATRNVGIKHAKGDYLAFLDADDLWDQKKLERQIAVFSEKLNIHGVFGKLQQFISSDLSDDEKKRYACPPISQAGYSAGCLLIKHAAFLQVGLFSEQLKAGEFIEWYIRAKQSGIIFEMIDHTLMYRRIHGNNTVLSDIPKIHAEYLKIVRMKLKNNLER